MNDKRTDKIFAILRIEAVLDSRSKLVDRQNGLFFIDSGNVLEFEELTKAYDNLEESYADVIIAEAKYLESLKEGSSCTYKTPTYADNLEYGHKKQTSVLNKDVDIDKLVEKIKRELKDNINI